MQSMHARYYNGMATGRVIIPCPFSIFQISFIAGRDCWTWRYSFGEACILCVESFFSIVSCWIVSLCLQLIDRSVELCRTERPCVLSSRCRICPGFAGFVCVMFTWFFFVILCMFVVWRFHCFLRLCLAKCQYVAFSWHMGSMARFCNVVEPLYGLMFISFVESTCSF